MAAAALPRPILGFLDARPLTACWQMVNIAGWAWALAALPLETAALVINCSWYGAAVVFFCVVPDRAMDWLAPRKSAGEPLYGTVEAALRFLGGMNAALLALSASLLRARTGPGPALFAVLAVGQCASDYFGESSETGRSRRPGRRPVWSDHFGELERVGRAR